jgi:hypothetical protein
MNYNEEDSRRKIYKVCPGCQKELLFDPIWGFGGMHPEFCSDTWLIIPEIEVPE